MSWNGFLLEGSKCRSCGKALDGENGDRPAESYMGTYTGLCSSCCMAPAYVMRTDFDGAQHWSYPPHCPSWRRDREDYRAYPDCPDCKGAGCQWVSRSLRVGGSYRSHCERCSRQYWEHPIRVADRAFEDALDAQKEEDLEFAIKDEVRRGKTGWTEVQRKAQATAGSG